MLMLHGAIKIIFWHSLYVYNRINTIQFDILRGFLVLNLSGTMMLLLKAIFLHLYVGIKTLDKQPNASLPLNRNYIIWSDL